MPSLTKGTKPRNVKAIAAVAGGLLAFAVLGYLLVISPQKSHASKLTTDIATANAQLVAVRAASQVKPPVDPRVDDLFRLTKAMPATTDMPGVLIELSRVAEETGIKFDSITPASPTSAGSYQAMPVSLVFRGNYYELSDFLFRLNNLVTKRDGKLDVDGRLYSVDSVDFSKGEGNNLSAQISTTAFIYGAGDSSTAVPGTSTPAATTPAPATPTPTATPPATAPTGGTG